MSIYALVDNKGRIINTIVWDGEEELTLEKGTSLVLSEDGLCQIGGEYKDGTFSPPDALPSM